MDEIKIKGIVIKAIDFKDSDKIVTIFSAEKGIIKARVRGVKKKGAKLAFAVQPFAFIEFMLTSSGDFYTVINATSIDQFFDITSDFDKYILSLSMLEVCEKTIKENERAGELFVLILRSLKVMCYQQNVNAMVVFIKFMINSFKLLGFNLSIDKCACCNEKINESLAFSFDYNGLLCQKCINKNYYLDLSKTEFAILKNINLTDIDNLSNLKFFDQKSLVSVISLLCKDFRLLTDEEILAVKQFL